MPIVKLTQEFVNNSLICPADKKRIEYCDRELPGLIIIVSPISQGGTYFLRFKNGVGKTSYIKISRTLEMSLINAKAKAKLLKLEIANGADPSEHKRIQKKIPTLTQFYDDFYLNFISLRKRSYKNDMQLYEMRIKGRFGHLQLNKITKQQLVNFHSELRASGLACATSDHYLKWLSRVFNVFMDLNDGVLKDNPASRVKLFNQENKVEHYLNAIELEKLMHVLQTSANRPVCSIAMFLLSTGARMNEVLSAKWVDINLETHTWKIPALNSKSKKVRSVPLNQSAINILLGLCTKNEFEYLFVNCVTGNKYTNIFKAWQKIRNEAALPHLRIHDLRHQYASFLVNSGRTLYEVQKILGHSTSKVTERYSHLSSATLIAAANSASVMINAAMGK